MAKPDIYTRVTEKIIADLEAGTRPWYKPWDAEHLAGRITRPLRHDGVAYRGLNIILLWAASVAQGYAAPTWMTYRQALELGGQVRKGSKGQLVIYADKLRKTETDDAGQDREVEIPFMKGYTVFNVDQIEGLPEQYYAVVEPMPETAERDATAEAFFAATEADIGHGGSQAYYAVEPDYVQMPPFETFETPETYYSTLGHEICHNAELRIMPCHPNYEGACVPVASDVDCAGGSGNGPAYVRGPVYVVGPDVYGLDRDGDGVGCEK